jgi:mannosylglycerate hydrolase MGH1-like protein
MSNPPIPELKRLTEDVGRERNWKRWGPYLSERQWGTVREDYSDNGTAWDYFPHDHARSRAYRWGEDGLLGICDRQCRLCFALALWNGRDPILKERLFGLTNSQGNHGEDVKECYFYIDSAPTHSYLKALYKYPHAEFPYTRLVEENSRRGREDREFEITDTGVFDGDRYFDVFAEYAKAAPDDILIRITIANRGPEAATIHALPTLWFRNTWSWGSQSEGGTIKPRIEKAGESAVMATHPTLGVFRFEVESPDARFLFTENETNLDRLFRAPNASRFVKDAFDDYVVHGRADAVNPDGVGTKAAAYRRVEIPARGTAVLRMRLFAQDVAPQTAFGDGFDEIFSTRIKENDEFYATRFAPGLSPDQQLVARQAYAGLLWSKQYFHYVVKDWLAGDPAMPKPPPGHQHGRNSDWPHFFANDVLSMPDKWEYPWFAAWDLAFHMIPFARIDPEFAKRQLLLLLREWYMHPNGQIPAYEWAFDDVNPPVHAWACWRAYKIAGARGARDTLFLERTFQKLLLNFTWWVNRKDADDNHIFSGGFLGLDNVGIFDRSKPLPGGQSLEQADGTAWMAFYCGTMLSIAMELAKTNMAYEDIASKFFEHFVEIVDAMNCLGGQGLWNEEDGFYYDQIRSDGQIVPVRVRSMVGIIPLLAVENLDPEAIDKLPGFRKRMEWFLENRKDLAAHVAYCESAPGQAHRLLAIPSRERLLRMLRYVLDENEFLSPFGIRSLSAAYRGGVCLLDIGGEQHCIDYEPAESRTWLFGGNSNWRGPIWFPVNYLLIEALERYHHFYGDGLRVEFPTGSGKMMNLQQVATELARRLARIFHRDEKGERPCFGGDERFARDPHWSELVWFHEHFHGDTGRGLGATHQTGWTALITRCLNMVARADKTE